MTAPDLVLTVFNAQGVPVLRQPFPSEHIRDIPDAVRWVRTIETLGGYGTIRRIEKANTTAE